MTFIRPSLSALIARAQADIDARLPGADSRVRRNVLDVLARVHAGAMHGAYGMIDDAARFLPDVAEGDRLARWGSMFGIARKPAVAAEGVATLSGSNGSVVAIGTVLVRADGARYRVTATTTIAGGTAAATIEAEEPGLLGAMVAGQALTFLSPVAGVQAAALVAEPGVGGGADVETDSDLRGRILQKMRAPVRGGAASDYVFWALEMPGVTRAWVYENWNGLGTVKVLFVMDGREAIVPEAGDVAAVSAHIEALRPVCAAVTVAAPVANPLDLTIDITPDTPEVRAAVAAELCDLVAREASPGGTLLISHIREAVSLAAGEADHAIITPTANVTSPAGEIATLGTITWA